MVTAAKAEGRTANPGVACSPKIPGAPPNRPLNVVEVLGEEVGAVEAIDGVKEKDVCLKGVGEEGGELGIEFLFKI